MAMAPRIGPSGIFYGWWVALALSLIVFLSSGIRFTIGFLFDVTGGYGAAFGAAGALLLSAAILSLSIDEKARPACRTVPIPPRRPHPVAGGS